MLMAGLPTPSGGAGVPAVVDVAAEMGADKITPDGTEATGPEELPPSLLIVDPHVKQCGAFHLADKHEMKSSEEISVPINMWRAQICMSTALQKR